LPPAPADEGRSAAWLAHVGQAVRRDGRLAELTGTLRGEIHDVLASDDHVVVLQTTRGERDGHGSLEDREAIVLHVRDGTIVEVWEHPGDVYAMDAFFS
jgi:ketosteroid isomerase-like protein